MKNIEVIAFDADDTLWVNEPYYRKSEDKFCRILQDYIEPDTCSKILYNIEIKNIDRYGYGTKSFMLSMIETALSINNGNIPVSVIADIIKLGKSQIDQKVEVLPGVQSGLEALKNDFRLIVATKGDLLDQERKLAKSGLGHYFHHVEVMSEKNEENYRKLLKHLDITPDKFLMIGNSLKSDIIPVINLGGHAIHIPFHTTWAHEHVDTKVENIRFKQVTRMPELVRVIRHETARSK